MLALNVSKDILSAFVVVNDAMEQTTENFEAKVLQTYAAFDKAEEAEPAKVKAYNDKAKQVRELSAKMIDYLSSIKYEMYSDVDGISIEDAKKKTLEDMESKDNFDKPSDFFIGQTENGKAFQMHAEIKKFKEQLVTIVGDTGFTLQSIKGLETEGEFKNADGENETWERHNFEHIVAAACFTLLNKMIGEVRNIEFEATNFLFKSIDAGSFKFDNVNARVIPNSRIVFSGDAFEADIIVAAFDSRQNPVAYWGGGRDTARESDQGNLTKLDGVNGVCHLKIPTGGVGDQRFAGFVKVVGPDGQEKAYSFKESYTVTKPAAAVAADKMNVFYAGIPNPVTIAAPVAPEKLKINWGGASATSSGGGKYEVTVPQSLVNKELTVVVAADLGGKTQEMGKTSFRVKSVPDPEVSLGGQFRSGRVAKDQLLANPMVTALMSKDFNYELRWKVIGYRVTFVNNGIEDAPISSSAGLFPDAVQSKIRASKSGTVVEFSEIKITSIAGTKTLKNAITIRIR
jgi:gliding motility-associated protein GldM